MPRGFVGASDFLLGREDVSMVWFAGRVVGSIEGCIGLRGTSVVNRIVRTLMLWSP